MACFLPPGDLNTSSVIALEEKELGRTDKSAVGLLQLVFSWRKVVPMFREEKGQLRQNKRSNERTSVVPTATPLQLKQFNKFVVQCACITVFTKSLSRYYVHKM